MGEKQFQNLLIEVLFLLHYAGMRTEGKPYNGGNFQHVSTLVIGR